MNKLKGISDSGFQRLASKVAGDEDIETLPEDAYEMEGEPEDPAKAEMKQAIQTLDDAYEMLNPLQMTLMRNEIGAYGLAPLDMLRKSMRDLMDLRYSLATHFKI